MQSTRTDGIVYLCGGINGLSDAAAMTWREEAKLKLTRTTLDPMRRDYRGREDQCVDEIIAGDMCDIDKSEFLLVNGERPSWGTAMEVFAAHTLGKKVYVFCSGSVSPWLRGHSTAVLPTMQECINAINGNL